MGRRYGAVGEKPVWAWLVECVLHRVRPGSAARYMFLGPPPDVEWPAEDADAVILVAAVGAILVVVAVS
ncbi:MAG TPA: hypothetical protein VGB14_16370 [Acidimicrobiales bacterium]